MQLSQQLFYKSHQKKVLFCSDGLQMFAFKNFISMGGEVQIQNLKCVDNDGRGVTAQ